MNIVKPTISASSKTVKVGKTITLSLKNTNYKAADITWVSEDPETATVAAGGKVTGVKAGTVKIYTETGGIRNECVVTVTN